MQIAVRSRPVDGNGGLNGLVATHVYLVLLKNSKVVDSLSFDPKCSDGFADGKPDGHGSELVVHGGAEEACLEKWLSLTSRYKTFAKKPYCLSKHNCCDAVSFALVGVTLTKSTDGIKFAREANNLWDNYQGKPSATDFTKKNL